MSCSPKSHTGGESWNGNLVNLGLVAPRVETTRDSEGPPIAHGQLGGDMIREDLCPSRKLHARLAVDLCMSSRPPGSSSQSSHAPSWRWRDTAPFFCGPNPPSLPGLFLDQGRLMFSFRRGQHLNYGFWRLITVTKCTLRNAHLVQVFFLCKPWGTESPETSDSSVVHLMIVSCSHLLALPRSGVNLDRIPCFLASSSGTWVLPLFFSSSTSP
jgi:hypothetical protein